MQKYSINDRNRDRDMQNCENIGLITWLVPLPCDRPYFVLLKQIHSDWLH